MNKVNMQEKAINFGRFVSSTIDLFMPEDEMKTEIKNYCEHYFEEQNNYLDFMFVYIAGLCSLQNCKETIQSVRDLAFVDSENIEAQNKKMEVLQKFRKKMMLINKSTENILNVTDVQLEAILTRFCQYIHLFTAMYFKEEK